MKAKWVLTRHPAPDPTESMYGYLLRLSQANGYPNTYYMLADSGMWRTGGHIGIDFVAQIANRQPKDLPWWECTSRKKKKSTVLGQPVSRMEINDKKSAICPACVHERGFIQAHFSLRLMTNCPEHNMLLSKCPGCGKLLTWMRRGLLECNCGQRLDSGRGNVASAAAIEILDIVRRRVLSLPAATATVVGLPVRALGAMNLRGLLFVIRSLGRRCAEEKGQEAIDDEKS